MQVDYKNKCGTCIHIKPNIKNKYGECTYHPSRGLGHLSLSRVKCRNYKFNEKAYCKCGIFIQGGWNYCANCGKIVGGIISNELVLQDALKFYANKENHEQYYIGNSEPAILKDAGKIARVALGQEAVKC